MTEPITYIDYPLDRELLLKEANEAKNSAEPYGNDPRYPGQSLNEWLISKHNSNYINKIMEDFGVEGKPRFYWLKENFILPEHVDYNTTCAINFVLSDNPAPVSFGDKEYIYTMAILNTTVPHSVRNGPAERLLFKISIFDETYEDLINRIKFKK